MSSFPRGTVERLALVGAFGSRRAAGNRPASTPGAPVSEPDRYDRVTTFHHLGDASHHVVVDDARGSRPATVDVAEGSVLFTQGDEPGPGVLSKGQSRVFEQAVTLTGRQAVVTVTR